MRHNLYGHLLRVRDMSVNEITTIRIDFQILQSCKSQKRPHVAVRHERIVALCLHATLGHGHWVFEPATRAVAARVSISGIAIMPGDANHNAFGHKFRVSFAGNKG